MNEFKRNSPPKFQPTVVGVTLITFIFWFAAIIVSAQTTTRAPLDNWSQFLHVWDSLEQADDTYFDWLTVEQWQSSFSRLKARRGEIPDSNALQLEFIEVYLSFFMAEYLQCIPKYQRLLESRSDLTQNQLRWCLVNLEEAFRRTGNLQDAIPIRKERIALGFDRDFFEFYEEAGLYQEAIVEYTEHNDLPKGPLQAFGFYARIGRLYHQDGQFDSAIFYYEKAYEKGLSTVDKEDYPDKPIHYHRLRKFYTYQMKGAIGLIYVTQGRFREAIPLLQKDIATCKEINEVALTVPKRLGLAEAYLGLQHLPLVKNHLDTVLTITRQMDWVDHQLKYLEIAGKYYFQLGSYDSSAIFLQRGYTLKDSLQTIKNRNKIIATTAFLDNERQGKLIAQQRLDLKQAQVAQTQQRQQLGLLIGVVFIVVLIAALLYRDTKRKQKAQAIAEQDRETIAKQAEDLKELDQAKTRFFANISHEFRTPLTLIEGPIQAILGGKITSSQAMHENLEVAGRNAQTLRNLIDELLDFNKLEAGDLQVSRRPVLLQPWIGELTENYQYLATQNNLSLHTQIEIDPKGSFLVDTQKVEHVLNNLISNAVKYANSTITFNVKAFRNAFEVAVTDDGDGLEQKELSKVFERFYQTKHGRQLAHSSGIGLAYVKEIITLLSGQVSVSSQEGAGTTFSLSIPVESLKKEVLQSENRSKALLVQEPYAHPNNKVLIVEDNAEMRRYIRQVIGDEFETVMCTNGAEALQKLEEWQPDLIISDVMMPVMDGVSMLKQVKTNPKLKSISLIMLTARRNEELKLEALNLGLDDYMTKPFSPLELEIRVKNLLANQYERWQWLQSNPMANDEIHVDPIVEKLRLKILENVGNNQFGVVSLAELFNMSDRQLTRITRQATGMSPAAFIREVRLGEALEILQARTCETITEVAEKTGLGRASHFSKIFFERFGRKPAEYLKNRSLKAVNP